VSAPPPEKKKGRSKKNFFVSDGLSDTDDTGLLNDDGRADRGYGRGRFPRRSRRGCCPPSL